MNQLVQFENSEGNVYPVLNIEDIRNLITINTDVVEITREDTFRAIRVGNVVEISMLGKLKNAPIDLTKNYILFTLDKKIRPKAYIYFPFNFGIGNNMWHPTTPQTSLISPSDGIFWFRKEVEGDYFQMHITYAIE